MGSRDPTTESKHISQKVISSNHPPELVIQVKSTPQPTKAVVSQNYSLVTSSANGKDGSSNRIERVNRIKVGGAFNLSQRQ